MIRVNTHTPINNFEVTKHVQELKIIIKSKKKNIDICLISFPLQVPTENILKITKISLMHINFITNYQKNFLLNILTINYYLQTIIFQIDHLNINGSIEFTKVVLKDCFKENNL